MRVACVMISHNCPHHPPSLPPPHLYTTYRSAPAHPPRVSPIHSHAISSQSTVSHVCDTPLRIIAPPPRLQNNSQCNSRGTDRHRLCLIGLQLVRVDRRPVILTRDPSEDLVAERVRRTAPTGVGARCLRVHFEPHVPESGCREEHLREGSVPTCTAKQSDAKWTRLDIRPGVPCLIPVHNHTQHLYEDPVAVGFHHFGEENVAVASAAPRIPPVYELMM